MNEKVEVTIGNRRLEVEIEGLTPLEITALAEQVSRRMEETASLHKKLADTSKLALLACLSFAAELDKERAAHATTRNLLESKAEQMSRTLQAAVEGLAASS